MSATSTSSSATRRNVETTAIVLFVIVNLFAPFMLGEMYPFTVSPMFCDQPNKYCTYELFDESGQELELEQYGLHLVYDGNPPGLGMGIEAKSTLHAFGEVPELEEVVAHLREVSSRQNHPRQIRIVQSVVCCNGTCPETETRETLISFESGEGD